MTAIKNPSTETLAAVYQYLVAARSGNPSEISGVLAIQPDQTRQALDALTRARLITASPNDPESFIAPKPGTVFSQAVDAFAAQVRDGLEILHCAADVISPLSFSSRNPNHNDYSLSEAEVMALYADLSVTAHTRLMGIFPEVPTRSELEYAIEHDMTILQRGVTITSIYPDRARYEPHVLEYARATAPHGGIVRTSTFIPGSIRLVDESVAILSRSTEVQGAEITVIRSHHAAKVICGFVDELWNTAIPVTTDLNPRRTVTHRQASILRYLASGLGDAEIGTRLACSARTVQRDVDDLIKQLRVRTRFELAILSERRGWVP